MGQQTNFTYKLERAVKMIREKGMILTMLQILRHYLIRVGIQVSPFYYMKEVIPSEIPDLLTALPEGFEFSVFGSEEVMGISKHPERKGYANEQYVINNFNKGDTCLGVKYKGGIAAFTWFSLEKSKTIYHPVAMKENEAYLFDMYVLNAYRGKNLAPVLRYKNYEILKEMGRDTFYSITEYFNTPSFRFKQKLNAKVVFLGLYVEFFRKYRNRWVLKRY